MTVQIVNPANGASLTRDGDWLSDGQGARFPIVAGVPRICAAENYTVNFGLQWTLFAKTQIDRGNEESRTSEKRFFAETGWRAEDLAGQNILEVGSGAGRFSHVVLSHTDANLWSVDYSTAVEANFKTNGAHSPRRFHLFQADIYAMPFRDDSFDKVFCFGVLQHTPDFEASVRTLVAKARPGGEIVVDFYPIKGFWTKIHAKYLLRPLTKRMPHERLLRLIERNVDWLIAASDFLHRVGLSVLTRFLPLCDIRGTLPPGLSKAELREWAVLDTFDQYSPAYDNPQRLSDVAAMFRRSGAEVTFADFLDSGVGTAAVIRARKR